MEVARNLKRMSEDIWATNERALGCAGSPGGAAGALLAADAVMG